MTRDTLELFALTIGLACLLFFAGLLSLDAQDRVDACIDGTCGTDSQCADLCGVRH